MDQDFTRNEEINPRENANIFSIATFFYNLSILKKGRKHDLEENDIYKVLPNFAAKALGDRIEAQWQNEKKTHKKTHILRCLTKCFGWTYFFYAVIQLFFGTAMILLQPEVFSKFVAYFQPGQATLTIKDAYFYGSAIIGLNLLNTFYNHNFAQLVTEYSMRVRTSVCSLIFRKALRVSPVAFSDITIGRVITLMSKDVFAIDGALAFIKDMIIGFLQLAVVTYILYQRVGVSAFPPIIVILLIIPIQLITGKKATNTRLITAKKTDSRFHLIQESMSSIKIIKMYTWQNYFENLITKARLKETSKLKVVYYLKAFIGWLGAFTINIAFYVLLISYIARGHTVQAETVYFVQQCLFALRIAITVSIPMGISNSADLIAAVKRIQAFLDAKEVQRKETSGSHVTNPRLLLNKVGVVIKGTDILKSVSLTLNKGLLLVTGIVGSGKSALLKTILGEYPISGGEMVVKGTFSYASEEPWLFPSTIRQNILFGEPYNKKRYQKVLNICALTHDFNQFDKLDQTIVGDRGINLSKGQQARITLARAVYKDSDIYLLDDCLSSLDNHVSKHIFEKCIKEFLKEKLCILVTNNLSNIKQMDNNGVLFLENGNTLTLEQQKESLDKRITYYIDEETGTKDKISRSLDIDKSTYKNDVESDETEKLLKSGDADGIRKKLYHEDKQIGGVLWKNYVTYYEYMGGFIVLFYLIVGFMVAQGTLSYSEKLISLWANLEPKITGYIDTNQTNSTEYKKAVTSRDSYLNLYTIFIIVSMFTSILRSYSTFYFCLNAARKLHHMTIAAILNSYMFFFDSHFIGNIINRLSKDFYIIDEYMPFLVFDFLRLIFSFIGVIALVASVNVSFFLPAGFLLIKLYFIQRLYLPTGRSLRRLEAATRSPVIGYLNSTLEGLVIARAAQQETTLKFEFDRHQDLFTSAYFMNQSTMRLFGLLLDIFGSCFMIGIVFKFIWFSQGVQAGDVGLAISQAMMLAGILQYAIKQIAELENVMTSVERVLEYADVKTEHTTKHIVSDWPFKGRIRYNDVSLTYQTDGNTVLKNISFEIEGRSKIGIVGRTGAGKSSIISTLFRLYDFKGQILIDNENINNISLDFLRSSMSIIPQDPVLFSGTIRSNIDPFRKYSDAEIWKALEKVHIKICIQDLNQPITDSGSSYSSGQKQLLCLARALVKNNKIIVLDEATANMDPETDKLLQRTIKECFRDCTVITIAHRLQSVMYCDRVLILDDGRIVEYGEPDILLGNKNGMLYRMSQDENFPCILNVIE